MSTTNNNTVPPVIDGQGAAPTQNPAHHDKGVTSALKSTLHSLQPSIPKYAPASSPQLPFTNDLQNPDATAKLRHEVAAYLDHLDYLIDDRGHEGHGHKPEPRPAHVIGDGEHQHSTEGAAQAAATVPTGTPAEQKAKVKAAIVAHQAESDALLAHLEEHDHVQ